MAEVVSQANRDADIRLINQIVVRAVRLYADRDVRVDGMDLKLDFMLTHFKVCPLRLEELLATDDFNFMHDVGGINKHLDRVKHELTDGFTPRFHAKA